MNILEQAKNEEFVKEQFIKGRILDDTKDYGRTQFVDEIYKLQQENKKQKEVIEKAVNDIQEIIDAVNKNTIIAMNQFNFKLEIIQDELGGSNDILKEVSE